MDLGTLFLGLAGILLFFVIAAFVVNIVIIVCNFFIFKKLGIPGWMCFIPVWGNYQMGGACACAIPALVASLAPIVAVLLCWVGGLMGGAILGAALSAIAVALMVIAMGASLYVKFQLNKTLGRPWYFFILAALLPIAYYPIVAFTDVGVEQ